MKDIFTAICAANINGGMEIIMNIMFVCGTATNSIYNHLGLLPNNKEGWISGYLNALRKSSDHEITYCFFIGKRLIEFDGMVNGIHYHAFYLSNRDEKKYCQHDDLYDEICTTVKQASPDVIHLFGTERIDSRYFLEACTEIGYDERIVVHCQGISEYIARHYLDGIPTRIRYRFTIRDIVKRENLRINQKTFYRIAENEKKVVSIAHHILGRTECDKAFSFQTNPMINYYKVNEILREAFYTQEATWKIDKVVPHRIFLSQYALPLKGMHILLEATSIIQNKYPDVSICVTGKDPRKMKPYLRTSYQLYIVELIKRYGLDERVYFLGVLDEQEMCEQYKLANVFVSCSTIENSSNAIGEALMIGCPAVVSDVGGAKDMIKHGENGFLFPANAPYMLAYYLDELFENDEVANRLSENGVSIAKELFNVDSNVSKLLEVYRKIINSNLNN